MHDYRPIHSGTVKSQNVRSRAHLSARCTIPTASDLSCRRNGGSDRVQLGRRYDSKQFYGSVRASEPPRVLMFLCPAWCRPYWPADSAFLSYGPRSLSLLCLHLRCNVSVSFSEPVQSSLASREHQDSQSRGRPANVLFPCLALVSPPLLASMSNSEFA